jgi:hypothetical protein
MGGSCRCVLVVEGDWEAGRRWGRVMVVVVGV